MQKKMKPDLTGEQITVSNFLWQHHVLWLTFTRTMPQLKHLCPYGAWSVISHSVEFDIDWHPADRRDWGKLTIKRLPVFKYSFFSWTPWNRPLNSLCATVPSDQRSPTDYEPVFSRHPPQRIRSLRQKLKRRWLIPIVKEEVLNRLPI